MILRDQQNVIDHLRQTIDQLTREVEKRRTAEEELQNFRAARERFWVRLNITYVAPPLNAPASTAGYSLSTMH